LNRVVSTKGSSWVAMGANMGTASICLGAGRKEAGFQDEAACAAAPPKHPELEAACTALPQNQPINLNLPATEPEPEIPGDQDTLPRSSTMEEPAELALASAVPEAVPEVAPQAVVYDTQAQKRDDHPCVREVETQAKAQTDAMAETGEGTVDNKKRKEELGVPKPKSKGCSKAKSAEEERRQKALANWAKAKPTAKGKEGGGKKWKAKANADGKQ